TVPQATVRPGRELLLGSRRGEAAVRRLREDAGLDGLRADVRTEWEEDLERLGAGAAFPGVELFGAYLEPGTPSLLDHLPAEAVARMVGLATEQGERAEALLSEAGVRAAPAEVELDADLEVAPGLYRADQDVPSGFGSDELGVRVYSDAELFGRVRRVAARPSRRSTRGEATLHLEFQPGEL